MNFRPQNLLLVALTQAACWGYLKFRLEALQVLNSGNLLLLVCSTVAITAAGYLINDFYDTAIDARNKPQKALPDIPEIKQKTLWAYGFLNALGLLLALPVALAAGKISLLGIQAITIFLLWAYSAWWKRLPVIGNFVVALLTALSILLVVLYSPDFWDLPPGNFKIPETIAGLALFAFVLTWMREMVKDIEDLEGDRAEGCRTLPIVWGVKNTVFAIAGLSVLCLAALGLISLKVLQEGNFPGFFFITLLLMLPLAFWTVSLFRQKTAVGFHRHSNLLKLLMLGGLICLWVV